RSAGETTGLAGAGIRLTGLNDLNETIDCLITTTATGLYSFPNAASATPTCQVLRPGVYALEITPAAGLTHTGAFIGTSGGDSGGQSGANTAAPGEANKIVAVIVVTAGSSSINYDFGASGQGLSGYVYVDNNDTGVRDAG